MIQTLKAVKMVVALAAIAVLAQSGCLNAQPTDTFACTVKVVHRGQPIPGLEVNIASKEGAPVTLGIPGPTTDATGRIRVSATKSSKYDPFVDWRDEHGGWVRLALASVRDDAASSFCQGEQVLELPDTLVRLHIKNAQGELLPGAVMAVDNVGVRLEGRPDSGLGVVALKGHTGDHGGVEIPGLAPGKWRILAAAEQASLEGERTIELGAAQTVDVELVVKKSAQAVAQDPAN